MSKIYLLCKQDKHEDNIEHIIKVFSDYTQALKELYKYVGFYKEQDIIDIDAYIEYIGTFNFDNGYFILTKMVDQESVDDYKSVHNFYDIKGYITKDIWKKVIDELPEENTLKNLISFQNEIKEYKNQKEKVAKEIVESKVYTRFSIRKELMEKLYELNIKMPKLQLD